MVVTFAWLISGGELGQAWIENNDFLDTPYPSVGVQSFTFINPMGEVLIYTSSVFDNFYLTFGVTALISTIVGSFVYSLISNNLRIEWFANKHDFFSLFNLSIPELATYKKLTLDLHFSSLGFQPKIFKRHILIRR